MRKLKLEELGRISPQEFKDHPKIKLRILLDNVRSMHNVGSVFRTSDAFLVEKVYLCGITARPPHPHIRKTALGAEDTVEWEYHEDSGDIASLCKTEGYKVISMEQTDLGTSLSDFEVDPEGKYLLIIGNEVDGVSDEIIQISDHCLEIDQFGSKHSFNVSVAAGIGIWYFGMKMVKNLPV